MRSKESKLIVHIATDEKFIDTAYNIYEAAFPEMNMFLIVHKKENLSLKYLKKLEKYHFIKTDFQYIETVEQYCEHARVIIFHGMTYDQAILVDQLKKGAKKYVWNSFGAEVYNNNLIIKNESVGLKTYKTFVFSYKKLIKDILRSAYYMTFYGKKSPNNVIKESFRKMDYSAVLYEEELINYINLDILCSDIEHIKFTYYPMDMVISSNQGFVHGKDILLGNSASYTNNHLEAFEILEKFDLEDSKIIVPLSYGNIEYAKKIIDLGRRIFHERFSPITEFVSSGDYQNILQGCGIALMNHSRSQATGNILTLLYLGSKVFESDRTPIFHYLKRIGCHIYSVEHDLNVENKTVFNLLSIEQMKHNRTIVSSELSLDRVVSELREKLTPLLI